MVLEITDANFKDVVSSDQPVLVDFWAPWCQPCLKLGPTIEELANDYDGKVQVGKINTDENRESAIQYQINAIPTVMLFQNGEVVKKMVGMTPKAQFVEEIDKLL